MAIWGEDLPAGGCRINCLVVVRASKTRFLNLQEERLRIALAAPPVEGEANKTLLRFLASEFNLSKSQVRLHSGETSRRKVVELIGCVLKSVAEKWNLPYQD